MSEGARPFEAWLTVLVAVSAGLVGAAGYLSAQEQQVEDQTRAMGIAELNEANTLYLDANQIIDLDWQLFTQAEIATFQGRDDEARYLRRQMVAVQLGYLDEEGNGAAMYDGDYEKAWNAFINEMYRPYLERKDASDRAFAQSEKASRKALDYLFSTVLLAVAVMLGSVGMAARARGIRLAFLILGALFLIGSSVFVGFTWLGISPSLSMLAVGLDYVTRGQQKNAIWGRSSSRSPRLWPLGLPL